MEQINIKLKKLDNNTIELQVLLKDDSWTKIESKKGDKAFEYIETIYNLTKKI